MDRDVLRLGRNSEAGVVVGAAPAVEAEETAGTGVMEVVGAVEQLEPLQHGAVAAERYRLAARALPGGIAALWERTGVVQAPCNSRQRVRSPRDPR